MQQLISGVEDCIAKENWFGALFIAISLPDICGATEGVIKNNGARYKDWFNRYLKPRYDSDSMYESLLLTSPNILTHIPEALIFEWKNKKPVVAFTAEDCWSLRNACLHEGTDVSKLRKFKITPPTPHASKVHMNVIEDVLQLDLVLFCRDIVEGVRKWLTDMQGNPEVSERIAAMITVDDLIFKGIESPRII